ncbi:glycosyltransferase [Bythopirellula polymerisocia]|uniref:D-inositol 3-phosphate glycosyltransferase n=1 Tax=Bythopirellula polymerisocia TaxID=2528003 RepID=A0A5C6D1P9_9BACT|nr:glycosyltransferase [Bythopirellula polymerisocia]TWU30065.1 D-inositol 3-phosphate glycosyltransferase [Bythopirellula polymerisocia]
MTETLFAPPDEPFAPAVSTQRVLHVINGEHYSGAERVQDLLAQELPQFGYDVTFACVKPDRFPEVRMSRTTQLYRTPMRSRFDWQCGRKLAELIRQEDYALVHAHTPRSLLAGAIAARLADVPLVYHVHSPTGKDSTRWLQNVVNAKLEHWLLRRASRLITVSPSLQELMISQGFAPQKISYVPNGVPGVEEFSRTRPTGQWTLGMAALFRPRKGIEVLLEALDLLRADGHDVRLRAIGPFETHGYQCEVMGIAEKLGITGLITWTGFVSDIHAELRKVDLFVLPSLFGEGLPMVVLEALAAGVPVVASAVEGIPSAVRQGVDGLLVEPGNATGLAAAIGEIVRDDSPFDYESLCRHARSQHSANFSASAMAGSVAQVYREILG